MKLLSIYINRQVDILKWLPITLNASGPPLSHLIFVDDIALISKATVDSVTTMYECMHYFCIISGQKINTTKSKSFLFLQIALLVSLL